MLGNFGCVSRIQSNDTANSSNPKTEKEAITTFASDMQT